LLLWLGKEKAMAMREIAEHLAMGRWGSLNDKLCLIGKDNGGKGKK
jgi:hypothetical protein